MDFENQSSECGFVHYDPTVDRESIERASSDAAMEEMIRAEREKKRAPDDDTGKFWS